MLISIDLWNYNETQIAGLTDKSVLEAVTKSLEQK